jgi:hypothetical protein
MYWIEEIKKKKNGETDMKQHELIAAMDEQTLGVEIETYGISREKTVRIIARVLGTNNYRHVASRGYDTWIAIGPDGREWSAVSDSSVTDGNGLGIADHAEIVTPICTTKDIETIQEITRAVRSGGAKVSKTCGVHVHVGAKELGTRQLITLSNMVAAKEELLEEALDIPTSRLSYAKYADKSFIEAIKGKEDESIEWLKEVWYEGHPYRSNTKYDKSRYRMLNLHSYWHKKGTVEFRMFNSTLHAGEIKSYIQICLAMVCNAKANKRALSKKSKSENKAYTFRNWMNIMGMTGSRFKTARHHFTKRLPGNKAWSHVA